MRLRVLSVAFPFAPVSPCSVGGAERILADLDRALVSAGHESVVIACEGSDACGELIPVCAPPCANLDDAAQADMRHGVQVAIDAAFAAREFDLVHMHGLDFHHFSIASRIPVVVTLHLPIAWYPAEAWRFREPVRFCCVSHSQRDTCPPQLHDSVVIENGVPLPGLDPEQHKEEFAIVLGRICPEKNAHEALEAGTRAGIPVWLGGQVFPYRQHQRYFAEKIEPLLRPQANGLRHRFLGPLGAKRLQPLLARSRCLLHSTLAPETSSLVAMEALAAGTPVIAYPSGALKEIVENGVTGYLVRDIEEMAQAIRDAHLISPAACRSAAEQRFGIDRMIDAYFDLYASLVHVNDAEPLHA
jgi:glycosyltransferase involved in cell wall biosynthesis